MTLLDLTTPMSPPPNPPAAPSAGRSVATPQSAPRQRPEIDRVRTSIEASITSITSRVATVPPARAAALAAVLEFADALSAPTESLAVGHVRERMAAVRAVTAIADAEMVRLHQCMTALADTPVTGWSVDPRRELARHAGLRQRDARTLEQRSDAVDTLPALGELLATGRTTAAHVDAMAHALVAAGDDRHHLLEHADDITARAASSSRDEFDRFMRRLTRQVHTDDGMSRFRQQQRSTFLKMWNDSDGMVRLSGAFDPERGAALAGRLDRTVEAMFHSGDRDIPIDVASDVEPNDHRRALALHRLCIRTPTTGVPDVPGPVDERPTRAELVVHVDLHTLRTGLHGRSVCRTGRGADIPPAVARRLACEAEIIPVVLSGESVPLDVGRAKRLATVHQRRALEAHHDTCAVHDCDVGFSRCAIHHLHPWESGGPTSLDNLVPLCSRHHHDVHDHGRILVMDPRTRHVTLVAPTPSDSSPSGDTSFSPEPAHFGSSGDRPHRRRIGNRAHHRGLVDLDTGEILDDTEPS